MNKIRKCDCEEKKIGCKKIQLNLEIEDKVQTILVNEIIEQKLKEVDSVFMTFCKNKLTIKRQFFSKLNQVPNVYRYSLKRENGNFIQYLFIEKHQDYRASNFNDRRVDEEKHIPTIALILESPHSDEYENSNFCMTPKGTAQGKTGRLIHKKLDVIVNKSLVIKSELNKDEYRVIIINPIPVQTSLIALHKNKIAGAFKTLRNKVWICLWTNHSSFKSDFIDSLKELNPSIVFNCCTSDLKPFVSNEIKALYKVVEIDHPSSWFNDVEKIKTILLKKE